MYHLIQWLKIPSEFLMAVYAMIFFIYYLFA